MYSVPASTTPVPIGADPASPEPLPGTSALLLSWRKLFMKIAQPTAPGTAGRGVRGARPTRRAGGWAGAVGLAGARGRVVPLAAAHADRAAAVAAVPPDLVAVTARGGVGKEVTDGQVLDVGPARLVDLDPVAPRHLERRVRAAGSARADPGPVHDHAVSVESSQMDAGCTDQHPGRQLGITGAVLVVVAGRDQDPVPRPGGIDRGLDGLELAGDPPVGAHRSEEHTSELQSPCNIVCRL